MDRRMPCLQQRFGVLGKSIRVVRSSAISSRIRASPTRKGPFPVASPDDFGACAQPPPTGSRSEGRPSGTERFVSLGPFRAERLTQQFAPARQTQRSTHRSQAKRALPAGGLPAAWLSEVLVDETSKGLVPVGLARLQVEGEADASGEDDEVDRPEPAGETEPAADEVDVREEQV